MLSILCKFPKQTQVINNKEVFKTCLFGQVQDKFDHLAEPYYEYGEDKEEDLTKKLDKPAGLTVL
ncbi:MAG: hypothetical protein HYZ69_04125 [Candidatus Colwellbacteria bacterium]|nr:hypothetical protein [Candidatus Colwellbacteria bacterium]